LHWNWGRISVLHLLSKASYIIFLQAILFIPTLVLSHSANSLRAGSASCAHRMTRLTVSGYSGPQSLIRPWYHRGKRLSLKHVFQKCFSPRWRWQVQSPRAENPQCSSLGMKLSRENRGMSKLITVISRVISTSWLPYKCPPFASSYALVWHTLSTNLGLTVIVEINWALHRYLFTM
jgi:hypothetical protein